MACLNFKSVMNAISKIKQGQRCFKCPECSVVSTHWIPHKHLLEPLSDGLSERASEAHRFGQAHLLAFEKVAGHSTPCGNLCHKSHRKAYYPEGEKGGGGNK